MSCYLPWGCGVQARAAPDWREPRYPTSFTGSPAPTSGVLCCVSFWDPFSQVSDLKFSWRPHRLKFLTSYLLIAKPEDSVPPWPGLASAPPTSLPLASLQKKCRFALKPKKLKSGASTATKALGRHEWSSLHNFDLLSNRRPLRQLPVIPPSGPVACTSSFSATPPCTCVPCWVVAGSLKGVRLSRQDLKSLPHSTGSTLPRHI